MGASYSTEIAGATERQKERYGVFSLRTKQKQSLVVLEDLVDELMNTKNMNSLMSLFSPGSDQIKCTDMFIVLSSTLKKEFQLFKFPDPVRPSEISDIAYLPRSVYDAKYKDDAKRNELCNNIAWFMVRFTTLIFALAASLKIPQTLSFDISKPLFVPQVPNGKKLKFDLNQIDGHDNIEYMQNIMFISNSSVLINTESSVIFTPGLETSVGMIDIKEIEQTQSPLLVSYQERLKQQEEIAKTRASNLGYRYVDPSLDPVTQLKTKIAEEQSKLKERKFLVTIYTCDEKGCKLIKKSDKETEETKSENESSEPNEMEQPSAPVQPVVGQASLGGQAPLGGQVPPVPETVITTGSGVMNPQVGNVASVTTGPQRGGKRRKTRKLSNGYRRKTFKHRGGGDGNEDDKNSTKGLPAGAVQFILYKNGMTQSIDLTDPTRISFNDRVKNILNSFSYKVKADANPYLPLGNIKSTVITRLLTIANILKKQVNSTEGTSPAQYRAYILATQTEESGKKLKVSFCEDLWADKQVTRVLPYALLDALFRDKIGDIISSASEIEYEKIVNQFFIHKMMLKQDESSTPTTFETLKFTSAKPTVPEICSRAEYSIDNTLFIETLMEGHKALRDLYDTHIQSVIQFITTKLITPKFRGYKEPPQWTMNSVFANDSRGALSALESIIKEGRTMLVKHYFAVESIYIKTLEKLKEMGSGLAGVSSNPLLNNSTTQ